MATSIIAVIISGIACILNVIVFIINRKKDTEETVTEDALKFDGIKESLLKVNMKLDQVCTTTQETRTDIKAMQTQVTDMDKRVVILERDVKTLWNKVADIEGK